MLNTVVNFFMDKTISYLVNIYKCNSIYDKTKNHMRALVNMSICVFFIEQLIYSHFG